MIRCIFLTITLALATKADSDIQKLKDIDNYVVNYGDDLTIYLDDGTRLGHGRIQGPYWA